MTGVAIAFLVRESTRQGEGKIQYYAVDDKLSGPEKLAEIRKADMGRNWL